MSEHLKTPELLPKFEELELPAHATPEKPPARSAEASADKARQAIAETTISTERQPNPLERLEAAERDAEPATSQHVNRELKQITLQRELQSIRRQLPAPERVFSRLIHQPVIRTLSQAAGQTVSRPSGLLGGGLVAFLGTSGYLYLAKYIGFTYNYLVFLVLLVGGFGLGLVLEYLVHLATKSRRHD